MLIFKFILKLTFKIDNIIYFFYDVKMTLTSTILRRNMIDNNENAQNYNTRFYNNYNINNDNNDNINNINNDIINNNNINNIAFYSRNNNITNLFRNYINQTNNATTFLNSLVSIMNICRNTLSNIINNINNTNNSENIVDNIPINDLHNIVNILPNLMRQVNNFQNIFDTINQERIKLLDRVEQLTQDNRQLEENIEEILTPETTCTICQDAQRTHVNIVCGHMCACANCANRLNNMCPICRQEGAFIRVIQS
tara:strand:- start:471 stop:1232 length:762 start_codon:yes stop_codon:yes gene_type:complete